jgi:hypothetical protein
MAHKHESTELLERPPTTLRPAFTRLAAYYGAIALLFAIAMWLMDGLPADLWRRIGRLAPGWLEAGLHMIASVVLVFPLVFVYLRTRTRAKFDHSLLQTVVVLPLAVSAVLLLVRNSLAHAFSLAGVVAAIRFRNNLKESRDAVYIFTAIAIGFAAGIGQLGVAVIVSMLFCILELVLWRLDLIEEYTASLRRLLTADGAAAQQPAHGGGWLGAAIRHFWATEAAAGRMVVAAPAESKGSSDASGARPRPLRRSE